MIITIKYSDDTCSKHSLSFILEEYLGSLGIVIYKLYIKDILNDYDVIDLISEVLERDFSVPSNEIQFFDK